jgi:cell division septation protein DedD
MVAAPLDARAGDFPLQPAYLPFVRRLVVYTAGRDAMPLARATGESWLLPGALREPVVATPAGSIVRPARDAKGASVPLREAGVYALHDGTVRGMPIGLVAVNAPAAESDLTPMAPAELLAGTTRDAGAAAEAAPQPSPDAAEKRQGLWRLLLATLAVLLVTEMVVANRGWRGSADRRTLDLSEGRDA